MHFAEYRLWRMRALLDPDIVGFDRAMANFEQAARRPRLSTRGAPRAARAILPGHGFGGVSMSETQEAAETAEEQEARPRRTSPSPRPRPPPPPRPRPPRPRARGRRAGRQEAAPEAEVLETEPEPADEVDPEVVLPPRPSWLEEAIPTPVGPAVGRQAKVFLCERGHRTVAVWSTPTTCHARPTRSGGECGRPLYSIGELPEQVQKALNPLKASKKASR